MEAAHQRARTHIAIFPAPGMGHLIPLVELARKLIQLHGFSITFIIPNDGSPTNPQKALLDTFPAINAVFLPPQTIDESRKIEDRIVGSVIQSIPSLCKVLKESGRVSAFVADIFGSLAFGAVKELNIPAYLFFTSSAQGLSFCFYLPELDRSCTCEYRDLPEPVKTPGCVPVHGSDLASMVQDRKSELYKGLLEMVKMFTSAEGILVNSFLELEPDAFSALEKGAWPPVYPVGPLIRPRSTDDKAECLRWLDQQPAGSVLFVSFGSGGTLSTDQLKELALGLEISQQRFLFVARRPDDEAKDAAFFTGSETKMDPFDYLPSGFIERNKEKGFVLGHWAPQIEVLSHPAVGGFLTHCGWNSTLESIVHGVPLIAWPLYAEQKMNAVLVSEGLKVAIRVRENENGVVDSERISNLIKSLMKEEKGEEMRSRMRNLKDGALEALRLQCGSLANVAEKWKSGVAP